MGKVMEYDATIRALKDEFVVRARYPHCRLAADLTDYDNPNRRTVYRVERTGNVPAHRRGLGPWRETPESAWQGAAARIKVEDDKRAARKNHEYVP